MRYEVEMKFPVADLSAMESRLTELGAEVSGPQDESDEYFAHPARDFSQTDEALRIRRKGDSNFLTYKGPKIDRTTKTRREIDLPLPGGGPAARAWAELLAALGFASVGMVVKSRKKCHIAWQQRRIEVSLDEVEGLGGFVELELVVDQDQVESARACIASLAERLGLQGSQRRSYLEMLMEGS